MSNPDIDNAYAVPFVAEAVSKDKLPAKTSRLAIASLVCGGLSLFLSCFTGIIGLLLGIIALTQIGGSQGRLKGIGMAVTGIVLSIFLSMIPLLIAMLLPAVQQVRAAARMTETMNQMRQIGLAQLNFESAYKQFPGERIGSEQRGSGLSWRVHILPFLERQDLYEQFHLDEPWDSPHNQSLIPLMPEQFMGVGGMQEELLDEGETVFLRPIGNRAFPDPSDDSFAAVTFGKISDGTSNTICLLEANASEAVIWTKPDGDYKFDPNNPTRGLGSQRVRGVLVGFCDGSVARLDKSMPPQEWNSRFTMSAGDLVSYPNSNY